MSYFRSKLMTTNSSGDEAYTRKWHRCILLPLLRLTSLTEGFTWNDPRKILHGGQRMAIGEVSGGAWGLALQR